MNLSVRFFKRLFIGLFLAMIAVPVGLAVYFGVSAAKAGAQSQQLAQQLVEAQRALALQTEISVPKTSFPTDDLLNAAEPSADGVVSVALAQPTPLAYQTRYPKLYCDEYSPTDWKFASNTIYLTFDGGPSTETEKILDILDENDVKATFFVIAQGYANTPEPLREIVRRGHTLGIQSYTDRYGEIYASVESYLADFNAAYSLVEEITGVMPSIYRFPGGSINSYNSGIYPQLIAEMTRRGFTYYDWDVVNNDTRPDADEDLALQSVISGVRGKSRAIVLMHDASNKPFTTQSLPKIIQTLRSQGFSFAPLTPKVEPISFHYIP